MYECDIMYECKICRSIFRSLANFILHKRNYCREKINPLDYINNNNAYQENIYVSEENHPPKKDNKSLDKVIEKLERTDYVREVAKNILTKDLSCDTSSQKIKDMYDREEKSSNCNEFVLEQIDTNNSGVFQTLVNKLNSDCNVPNSNKNDSTKLQVMEIHKIVENDIPVLDPEGKICGFTSSKLHQTSIFPKSELSCSECNQRFASQKSLTNHIKCVHNPSRVIYVCPTCKDTFANPWCVYRHLLKVHRMTNKQVRRMREQVHNSWIRRGEELSIQKKRSESNQGATSSESQWINDIEGDNDFQMCAGCGKHFERKAALHSHSQTCAKRLEVCNNLKENAKKKEVEDAIEKAKLEKSADNKPVLTGASKRKSQSIWSYQRKPKGPPEIVPESFDSKKSEDPSSSYNTDFETVKNDIVYDIPNIPTQKPSPSDNETNSSLSPIIISRPEQNHKYVTNSSQSENIPHKQINHENCSARSEEDITYVINKNEAVSEDKNTDSAEAAQEIAKETSGKPALAVGRSNSVLTVDTSIIKTKEYEENDNNVNNYGSDVENTVFITSTKSEPLSSEENSCSSLNFSVRSTKSDYSFKMLKSSVEDNCRPRSDSFVNRNTVFNANEKLVSGNDFQLRSNSFVDSEISESCTKFKMAASVQNREKNLKAYLKPITKITKLISNTELEDSSSDENSQSQLNSYFKKSEICNSIQSQNNKTDTLLRNSHDLLSNEVTFEMFCKKVATVGKTSECRKKIKANQGSPRTLKRKRRLTVPNIVVLNDPDNEDDDDVIFVGETLGQKRKLNDTSLALEKGLAGMSTEEASQVSYSVDLSNLSYNNPLKRKQKNDSQDTIKETELRQRRLMKRRSRGQPVSHKTISKHEKSEFSFILRAAPYMNRSKLICIPCGLTFKSFNLLLWHMSAHFSWFRFQCSKCSFITFNKYDCMLHARKEHKLKETSAANFILPLPNWKTVLMSHEFRLLKDCNDLKGKHTDEKIGIDESQDQYIEDNSEILESDAILFGESSKGPEENASIVIEKENVKKRNKSGRTVIDIQETIKDFQKLPEPVELAMPADISEVIRTFSFDESTLSPDEAVTTFDTFGDESNDDWDLPKESDYEKLTKSNVIIKKDCDNNETQSEKNIRPSRTRTKAKQNDDFVYYDNDINNVLNSTEFFKGSPEKQRSDCAVIIKCKVSGKTVPVTQKKKM